jgi:hypothetical protein
MRSITLVAAAIGSTCWTVPALAQSDETSGIEAELAAMRAQMAEMAARMEALEGELTATKAEAAAASEQAGVAVASAAAAEENAQAGTEIVWKGAPEFSGEGGWSFKPRGRIQVDAGAVNAPDSASYEDGFGSEIRRARLGVEGDVPGGFGYKFEIDFAGNAVEVADALLSYSDGGLKLTAGHQNNFQSLEELTSRQRSPTHSASSAASAHRSNMRERRCWCRPDCFPTISPTYPTTGRGAPMAGWCFSRRSAVHNCIWADRSTIPDVRRAALFATVSGPSFTLTVRASSIPAR